MEIAHRDSQAARASMAAAHQVMEQIRPNTGDATYDVFPPKLLDRYRKHKQATAPGNCMFPPGFLHRSSAPACQAPPHVPTATAFPPAGAPPTNELAIQDAKAKLDELQAEVERIEEEQGIGGEEGSMTTKTLLAQTDPQLCRLICGTLKSRKWMHAP